jgi:hypothetical protein
MCGVYVLSLAFGYLNKSICTFLQVDLKIEGVGVGLR